MARARTTEGTVIHHGTRIRRCLMYPFSGDKTVSPRSLEVRRGKSVLMLRPGVNKVPKSKIELHRAQLDKMEEAGEISVTAFNGLSVRERDAAVRNTADKAILSNLAKDEGSKTVKKAVTEQIAAIDKPDDDED